MSNKKCAHWCDPQHQKPKEDNIFVIGEEAKSIYNALEKYLLHDINKDLMLAFPDENQEKINKNYVIKRFYSILDNAEQLELTTFDANSVYAIYNIDYKFRRQKWITARTLCFDLVHQLNHIASILIKGSNLQKYVDLSARLNILSDRIKNVMASDDIKRKKYVKEY